MMKKNEQQENCNVVRVEYHKDVNMVAEFSFKKDLTFDAAEKIVKESKQPLYFYVKGSEGVIGGPHEFHNRFAVKEYKKVID